MFLFIFNGSFCKKVIKLGFKLYMLINSHLITFEKNVTIFTRRNCSTKMFCSLYFSNWKIEKKKTFFTIYYYKTITVFKISSHWVIEL